MSKLKTENQLPQTIVSDSYVWAFLYSPCIHESSFRTVSLHKTEKGAEIAMEFHKENKRKEHERLYSDLPEEEKTALYVEFGTMEAWDVQKFPVLE
jgi:hypothetical protein